MRLLNKIIGSYLLLSVVLLLAAIPIFYYALDKTMVANIDENLIATKTRILPKMRDAIANKGGHSMHYYNYDIEFERSIIAKAEDSITTVEISDSFSNELLPNRLLTSLVFINREYYRLQIKTSLADRYALIKRIVLVLMSLLILLLLGLMMINRFFSKKILSPFYTTLRLLHNYRVDRHEGLRLDHSSVKEFNDLNRAIEQLTQRDYQAYQSQKEFAENASHEMQSPLAVFQSKLELLMQTKPLNEEQAALITDLANSSQRMGRLNKSLILLTKIESNQFPETESLSVREILEKLMQQYEFQRAQKSIRLTFEPGEAILLQANKTLIEILLSNLLSNAIRHNVSGGRILIRTEARKLSMLNTGRNTALPAQRLFKRFQKDSNDPASTGLGLEIMQKICLLYGFRVNYAHSASMHEFSISF